MNERTQQIINDFKDNLDKYQGGDVLGKGAITGVLEKACGGKENRYLVLKVLTGKTSSKDLTEPEWYALLCLVQPHKPEGGKWQSQLGSAFTTICYMLILHARLTAGMEDE